MILKLSLKACITFHYRLICLSLLMKNYLKLQNLSNSIANGLDYNRQRILETCYQKLDDGLYTREPMQESGL